MGHGDAYVLDNTSHRPDRPHQFRGRHRVNEEILAQSLAILDGKGRVIGGAFNETMPPFDVAPPFRKDDPFLDTVVAVWEPVYAASWAPRTRRR